MSKSPQIHSLKIAVVEWHWGGHHPTYFKYFCKALLELGHEVLAICPSPDEISCALERENGIELRKFSSIYRGWPRLSRGLPHFGSRRLQILHHFSRLGSVIRRDEKLSGHKVSLVLFACLYDREFEHANTWDRFLGYPWGALYLHCRTLRMPGTPIPDTCYVPDPKRLLSSPSARVIATLDEGTAEDLSKLIEKPVVFFPDLANLQSESNHPLTEKLREFSGSRPLVACTGFLQPSKGVLQLINAAKHLPDMSFVIAGNVAWSLFSEEEQKALRKASEELNIMTIYHRLDDGATFNAVLQSCDLVYAAYIDFPYSSNILTKAAHFRKPAVVSDGYLMAERVREYETGFVIRENRQEALLQFLRRSQEDHAGLLASIKPRWDDYMAVHNYEQLRDKVGEFVSLAASNN